ncbi:unnamed protein product [Adineta steineri]|uniref:Uncharacterized protein n=1 Tax=Adineta steineri TaxID=433720 RepID=A0A814QQX5_9BILA|nr:unnamed protein product [Adineta steineri]CAF4153567.1 unnamed protein product [Adineta steineri]
MANNKTQCFKCNKEKITYSCEGCLKRFCLIHLTEHQQILNEELNHIINDYDQFKQRINEQKQNPQNHSLIKQINQWERNSIEKIQQKAQNCREILIQSSQIFINDIEKKFKDLSEQIKQIHKENELNEINLNYLRNQLIELTKELNNPSNISIQQDSQSFISEISIIISKKSKYNKWKQNAITVAGGNGRGQELNQLNNPIGISVDKKKNILVADCHNDYIVEWKCNANEGQTIAGGNGANGKGDRLNQLDCPNFIFVDEDQSVYVSDRNNHRVVKWRKDAKEGRVVAGGNSQGRNLNQLSYPSGVIVDHFGQIYVADCMNDRVVRWCEGKQEGEIVVGGNGEGNQLNQLKHPCSLSFDDEGNLYVADTGNHRIEKFEIIL